ncbi:baculoviral IAP repeat-containing protein 5 [Procambarus clarkii]|uniref:baculoviral IAP repeat-containing protein 5 n=1 Tax=Procambarus clarkii TaxID=6728 RepID=UPI00374265AB
MNDRDTFEMFDYDKRLKSFKKWPFGSDTGMSKEKMAAAGFYFTGSKKEPDLAKCFVCHKELDGWEEQDDPWEEHKKHAPYCRFTKLDKPESEMLFHEFHEMESERQNNLVAKFVTRKIDEFKKQAEKTREGLQNLI